METRNHDIFEDVYETKEVGIDEVEAAWNSLYDYFSCIYVNPRSYGVEVLLFWAESTKSDKVKAICLARLLWMLLNDNNAAADALFKGNGNQIIDSAILENSGYEIDHHSKDKNYWESLGILEAQVKEFLEKYKATLDKLFMAEKINELVDEMEEFLSINIHNKIKIGFLHLLFRETVTRSASGTKTAIFINDIGKRIKFN